MTSAVVFVHNDRSELLLTLEYLARLGRPGRLQHMSVQTPPEHGDLKAQPPPLRSRRD